MSIGAETTCEIPLSIRYDPSLGGALDWIDIDGSTILDAAQQLNGGVIYDYLSKQGKELTLNVHSRVEPQVIRRHPEGRVFPFQRTVGDMDPAFVHVFLGSIVSNCTEDGEEINPERVEENLSEEILHQLGSFSHLAYDSLRLNILERTQKIRRELQATSSSPHAKALLEQVEPRQIFKSLGSRMGSVVVGSYMAAAVMSSTPGGRVSESLLGAAAGIATYAGTNTMIRENSKDLQAYADIRRQYKRLMHSRRFGESELKAKAYARKQVMDIGSFCVLQFKEEAEALAA